MASLVTLASLIVALATSACSGGSGATQAAERESKSSAKLSTQSSREGAGQVPLNDEQQESSTLELQSISANVWSVLSGDYACVDQLAAKPTCIETGDSLTPSSGSEFLDITVEVRNTGEVAQTLSAAGDLIAHYRGKDYRYSPIEQEASAAIEVQPLANGLIHAYYEVPVDVMNEAEFALSIKGGRASFVFETPAKRSEKRDARRAEDREAEESRKAKDAEDQAQYDKCWSLQDGNTPLVARDEYDWYVDNCSHMFDVSDYDTYLAIHGRQQTR